MAGSDHFHFTKVTKFMFLLLLGASLCLKPIILIPPLYGSNLWVSYNQTDVNWYCPESTNDEILWVNPKWVIPPMFNCMFQLMQLFYDEKTDSITSRANTSIYVKNFGGEEAVRYVDSGLYGYHFIESFATLIESFKKKGYTIEKDLFAAPYDWRMAPVALPEYWPKLQGLIEHAVKTNGNTKATIFGFSCGGHMTQQFLGEHTTQEWKDQYLDRAIMLAPSFGAAGASFDSLWEKVFPIVPILKNKMLADMIESMVVVIAHLPNHHVFGDMPIVRDEHDHDYNASQLADLLIKHGKITGDNIKILQKCQELAKTRPKPPGLPFYLIYNSGVQTDLRLHFKKGWNKPPVLIPVEGDGTVPAKGPQWACENWPADHPFVCVDMYRDHEAFTHQPLAYNPFIHELVFNASTTDDWMQYYYDGPHKHTKMITRAPYIVVHNATYEVREDIRQWRISFKP